MSKKIILKGKHTLDKLNNKSKSTRYNSQSWERYEHLLKKDSYSQIQILNKLFLKEKFNGDDFVKKEVTKKVNGYKNQDIKKKIYDPNKIINYDKTLEKLVISKLKCYYCRCDCLLIYDNVREKKQWTLDRIDNKIGHHYKNTVICCLNCNLKKGTMNDEKFKFTKQLNIIKHF
jgi:hypothetical protein